MLFIAHQLTIATPQCSASVMPLYIYALFIKLIFTKILKVFNITLVILHFWWRVQHQELRMQIFGLSRGYLGLPNIIPANCKFFKLLMHTEIFFIHLPVKVC
ncbi:hypothetical protein BGW37DRAFT_480066 [Umbelopsis sp. PMI_123]|nr:hypothetical protein BGW37DRAFT_480066 [Umbelopsis sp. PMI_123]